MNEPTEIDAPDHVPAELIRQFDFRHDPAMEIDPWSAFSALNDAPDIFYSVDQGGYWALTSKAVIEEVLSNPETFSSAYNSIPRMEGDFRLIPPNLDPPEHGKYRKIVTFDIFNSKAMDNIEEQARTILRGLISKLAPKGKGDFVADITRPFPVGVFLQLLGMPTDRLDEFSNIIEVFFRGENVEEVGAARMELFGFAQQWLASDADAENAHILRALQAAEVDGRPLTEEELSVMVLTLFFAGLDTVTAHMSFMIHFLATHETHRDSLVNDPSLIPKAVDEMLRRFGFANLCREVVEDTELRGVKMKKGDLVMVSSTMAGVDESAYPNAMDVDFKRQGAGKHVAFGKGIHSCAGQRLARIELNMLLEEVLPRFRNLRLQDGAEVRFLPGTIMSMRELPVVWEDGGVS